MQRLIKSFVLRAGRTSNRQQLALDNYLSQYALSPQETPWNLAEVFGREADTIVEIGFGMGQSLSAMALSCPDQNFIGIDVHLAGVGSLAADVHEMGLSNLRIVNSDAVEVFRHSLPEESLLGVQIFFPDPWPKKRHHKRRLVQSQFIELIIKKIKKGGFIHCATDWEEYAHQMREVLTTNQNLKNQCPQGGFSPRPSSRPLTKFEKRGQNLGHGVWDLIFTRVE